MYLQFVMMIYRLYPPQTGRPLTLSQLRMDQSAWTCTPPLSIKWTSLVTVQVSLVTLDCLRLFSKFPLKDKTERHDNGVELL